jgi:TolB-like protein
MKKLGLLSVMAAVVLMTQGCAPAQSISQIKQYDRTVKMVDVTGVNQSVNGYSINVATTTNIADTVDKIAQQLLATMKNKVIGSVAITSFVDLHKLNKTTHFGRVMGESFFNELNKRGVNVMDFRGQKALSINADGEFFLSRNVKKLNSPIENAYVLVGTYSKIEEGVIINSRIIDNANGKVIASSRVVFHSSDCRLFESCPAPAPEPVIPVRTIQITTDGCSTEECPCHSSSDNCSALDGCYRAGHRH